MYSIRTEKFEGPLDLLLALIEERKMDIAGISLAGVTDQYLECLRRSEALNLDHWADFLTVAAQLVLIKSKALLPMLELSQEEEEEIRDLQWQLAQYKLFKDAARKIGILAQNSQVSVSRESSGAWGQCFCPPKEVSATDLHNSLRAVVADMPGKEALEEEVVKDTITLEEKMEYLLKSVARKLEVSFRHCVADAENKMDIIISFLAVLEMAKQRKVYVEQSDLFSDIRVRAFDGEQ